MSLRRCTEGGFEGFEGCESPGEPQHEVLTVAEVASLLRLSRPAVYAALRRGDIPGLLPIGRALRVSRRAVVEWLAGQGCAPPTGGKPCR